MTDLAITHAFASGKAVGPDATMVNSDDWNDGHVYTGILPIDHGGSGLSSTPTDGQLLVGKTSTNAYVLAAITGTTNQVTVTLGSGTITLSGPQDLHTGASPTFVKVTAGTMESTVAAGTAPLIVASTTVVMNLNADLLDGNEGSYYAPASGINGSFTTADTPAKTVTVTNGVITAIV